MTSLRAYRMLLLILLSVRAHGAELPVVQVAVEPAVVNVGESVTLRVAVYAPTWFTQPPTFPSFELPNTVTRLPPNSSGPVSARVGHTTWSGVERRYQVFPLLDGEFRIQGRSLAVTYADPQSNQSLKLNLPIPDIVFNSQVPAGAASLEPYLAGQMLELQRIPGNELRDLQAGDALQIRYRATLQGLPSLFLPPLALIHEQQGLSVYADEPVLLDEAGVAVREETVTLVFDRGGSYTIPGQQLRWWNLRTGAVETTRLDPLTIAVTGASAVALSASNRDWSVSLLWLLGSLVLLLLAFVLLRKPLTAWIAARRQARADYLRSEAHAFALLTRTLQNAELRNSYHALLRWLTRLDSTADLERFCRESGDPELLRQLQLLRDRLFNNAGAEPDFPQLVQLVRSARNARFEALRRAEQCALPPLNP